MRAARLIKSLIYLTTALAYAYNFTIDDTLYLALLDRGLNSHDAYMAQSTISGIFGLATFVYFLKGCYFLKTWRFENGIDRFEYRGKLRWGGSGSVTGWPYENIERVMRYRESILASRCNNEAAELMAKTSWIDGMLSHDGFHTQKTRQYLDSRLAGFSNEDGLEFIKQGARDE